jgi:hypothetical protein
MLQTQYVEAVYGQLSAFVGTKATREQAAQALDVWPLRAGLDDDSRAAVLGRFFPAAVTR